MIDPDYSEANEDPRRRPPPTAREELKIVMLGDNGTGKTSQFGRLLLACPELAPMVLIATERGSEVLQTLVMRGIVRIVVAKSPEEVQRVLELLRKPVVVEDLTIRPARDDEGFRAGMVVIDSYSAVAKRAIEQEMDLGPGDVGPEGRKRRSSYGANQYMDWNGEARKRLEGMLAAAEDLLDLGIVVGITCAWKQIFDREKKDNSHKVQPALPGGPHPGGMSRALRGWARYQWCLHQDGESFYALTTPLSAEQVQDPRFAWARPFSTWPKSSVPDELRDVRAGLLPQVYARPDFGEYWTARRRALELHAGGLRGRDLLQRLADEEYRVKLPRKKSEPV